MNDPLGLRRLLLVPLLAALLCSGCSTIVNVAGPRGASTIFLGTRVDADAIGGDGSLSCRTFPFAWPIGLIDLPFSFALDVAILPFTLVYELLIRS